MSSSKLRTMGSSTQRPRLILQGPVTLTNLAQSPTVDEMTAAVMVVVRLTTE
jgi:hypothetical protein